MVFSSFPVYLDHPNLQQLQQQDHHQQGNPGLENHQLPTLPPPGPVQVGTSPGSIRPGSMVDRARLAKIPLPEAGLKCPRCDSTNTKFCYFNNYNLSQPRHFCKTCRRYWTRGGALRSVPVGGGCRRNKRSKSSNNSKNGGGNSADSRQLGTSTSTSASPSGCSAEIPNPSNLNLGSVSNVVTGHHFSQSSTQLTPLMAAFQNLNHHYGGFQPPPLVSTHNNGGLSEMGFQLGHNSANTNNLPAPGGSDEWRLPSLAPTNLYPFQGEENIDQASSGIEENNQGLNSTKQFLGTMENNQYWSNANAWTGFSGLNSSSAGHLL